MRRTFTRHAALTDNLTQLRAASAMDRLLMPQRLMDSETLSKTWSSFRPAVPLSAPGVVATGVGFIGGWGIFTLLFLLLAWPFRRR